MYEILIHLVAFCGCQNSSSGIMVLSSWYFQSPNALLTMIGHPLRCNPPVDLLSALFSVSSTLAFEILTAVPVTYKLALWKFMLYVVLPMRMILRRFAKFDFNVKVAFVSSCFHSMSLTQVT